VAVGLGYTDVSPKQLVRTAADRLYLAASTCAASTCDSPAQALRFYRAAAPGRPAAFARPAPAGEPTGVAGGALALAAAAVLHLAWTYRTAAGGALAGLRYTTFDTAAAAWSGAVEELAAGGLTDGVGQGVQTVALALDAAGAPHLAYLAGAGPARRAYYAHRAWRPNLAFDAEGRVVAAWLRGASTAPTTGRSSRACARPARAAAGARRRPSPASARRAAPLTSRPRCW
jgi:hypothetical protein